MNARSDEARSAESAPARDEALDEAVVAAHMHAPQRRPFRRALRSLLALSQVPVILLGALAGLHFLSLRSAHPVFCLVQIDGQSMEPTFMPGEQAAFARLPWKRGSVVVADVGETDLVVKRVAVTTNDKVLITGDNRKVTETYRVDRDDIRAVLVCRIPFTSPMAEESARRVWAHRHEPTPRDPPGLGAPPLAMHRQ